MCQMLLSRVALLRRSISWENSLPQNVRSHESSWIRDFTPAVPSAPAPPPPAPAPASPPSVPSGMLARSPPIASHSSLCPFHALTCATGFSMSGDLNASALLGAASIPNYVSALAVLIIVIRNSIASPSAWRVLARLSEVQGRADGRAGGRPGTCGRSTTPSCTSSSAATRKRKRFKRLGGRSHGGGRGRGKIAGGGGVGIVPALRACRTPHRSDRSSSGNGSSDMEMVQAFRRREREARAPRTLGGWSEAGLLRCSDGRGPDGGERGQRMDARQGSQIGVANVLHSRLRVGGS